MRPCLEGGGSFEWAYSLRDERKKLFVDVHAADAAEDEFTHGAALKVGIQKGNGVEGIYRYLEVKGRGNRDIPIEIDSDEWEREEGSQDDGDRPDSGSDSDRDPVPCNPFVVKWAAEVVHSAPVLLACWDDHAKIPGVPVTARQLTYLPTPRRSAGVL